jgi:hypothetical protein
VERKRENTLGLNSTSTSATGASTSPSKSNGGNPRRPSTILCIYLVADSNNVARAKQEACGVVAKEEGVSVEDESRHRKK